MADPEVIEESGASPAKTEPGEEKVEKESQKSGFNLKIIIIAAVAFIISIGGAFFLVKVLTSRESPPQQVQDNINTQSIGELYYFKEPIIVNLAESNAERYLKVNIVLELDTPALANELDKRQPQVLDMLINILSDKTPDDISTIGGRNRLKEEIIDRINSLLTTGMLINVYFTEFVIQ